MVKLYRYNITKHDVTSRIIQNQAEVKEKELAKMRYQWFREYRRCGNGKGYSGATRFESYSRRPKTSPKAYSEEAVRLIVKIRKITGRGGEHIWFAFNNY